MINRKTKPVFHLGLLMAFMFLMGCLQPQFLMARKKSLPALHVDGRNLKDAKGHTVVLHGFAQTYSPWFNEQGSRWSNYDVAACLKYNQGLIDGIFRAGWKVNFVRLHMDPYWSNRPGIRTEGEHDISAFSMERFKTYLDAVFVPMTRYAIENGLYVVMRPPGVCPQNISVGDAYQQYLLKVWSYVARHPYLKNNPAVMFELANEPVRIVKPDGSNADDRDLHDYFQTIVDTMRHVCNNILWIPGTGWQSNYKPYGTYPIKGRNIGYAVHCYPGWYNGTGGAAEVNYQDFARGWREQIGPVSDIAPVMVTEMDWADKKYHASWGNATTGVAGGNGFGANFKRIVDECGNVSWLVFTWPHILAQFEDKAPTNGEYTVLTDPESCVWPCYHWFEEYAKNKKVRSPYYH